MRAVSQNKKIRRIKKANSEIGFDSLELTINAVFCGLYFLAWVEKFHVHLARHP